MKRRMMVSGSFAALAVSGAAFGDFIFFTDPGEFFAAIEAQGKVSDGFWDFKPYHVGPGYIAGIDDPLNYLNAGDYGIWDAPGSPAEMPLYNIQFQSNLNPQGEGGPSLTPKLTELPRLLLLWLKVSSHVPETPVIFTVLPMIVSFSLRSP